MVGSLPEDDVKSNRHDNDGPTEHLGTGGGLHLNDALIGKHNGFTTLHMVDDGKDEAYYAYGDKGEAHAVEEALIRGAEECNPLEGSVEYGAQKNTEPTEDAGALGHEETEEEHGQYTRAKEALELLDEGEDTAECGVVQGRSNHCSDNGASQYTNLADGKQLSRSGRLAHYLFGFAVEVHGEQGGGRVEHRCQ